MKLLHAGETGVARFGQPPPSRDVDGGGLRRIERFNAFMQFLIKASPTAGAQEMTRRISIGIEGSIARTSMKRNCAKLWSLRLIFSTLTNVNVRKPIIG